ncbi:MAG: Bacitracin transport permease protein BcrC [Parcubacteria group bacterium GW2011_GWA2_47_8b]|uniref:Bacitracin transport permease protein BcrC n=2 Tax=Parcubacteria group TaxID=1794811 RepID=A0A0G1T5U0_9BACT|nr:MAG: Bacitracin transport permease protein BcrC [Candidatus Giovannonibacteria bacterium GW2011_GWB1_47_6b]KKU85274.1 MAG: Bacitracin transport permease protein BcrC [Parcubacteria group bacterium GW2011_GWA2_47_8b]KKU94954.1 MAG: Bacitracin transport permease protein BcrC [Parcubacteria group bacterium GW2011_GWA1_48_11b]OGY64063.1 MAG: hypothetical protein A3E64_00920 [Candidatus Harrisonbacteria bacterium RIFCSPHIGHO2_12_FULL_48_16]
MDSSVFNAIHSIAGQFGILDALIVFFAKYFGYFLVLGAAIFIYKEKDWHKRFYYFALSVLTIIISRGILAEIIRFFYFRARPFAALGFEPLVNHSATAASFPSGHAAFYFALALAMISIDKKRGWIYLAGAALIGLARVAAGVHWPSDILAGAIVGLISFLVVEWALVPKQQQ